MGHNFSRICAAPGCLVWIEAPCFFCQEHWCYVPTPMRLDLAAAWGKARWHHSLMTALCHVGVRCGVMTMDEAERRCGRALEEIRRLRPVCDQEEV